MGKADDFLNSDEALAIAAQADASGAQPPVTIDEGLTPSNDIPAQADRVPVAEPMEYHPLGKPTADPALPYVQVQAEQPQAQAQAQQQAQEAQQAAIRDWLVSQGYQGLASAPDDRTAVQEILNYAVARDQAMQQYAAQLQQVQAQNNLLMHQMQFAQQTAPAQQAQAQAPAAPAPFTRAAWLKQPDWDPSLEAGLTRNPETGELVAKPGYAADLPQKYLAYQAWRNDTFNRILSDPTSFAKDAGILHAAEQAYQSQLQSLKDELRKEFQQQNATQADFLFGQRFADQHGDWMFARDPLTGRPVIDPTTGRMAFSQEGSQVFQTANVYQQQYGMSPQAALREAYRAVSGQGSLAEQAAHELGQEVETLRAQLQQLGVQPGQTQAGPATLPLNPAAAQGAANARFMQQAHQAQLATRQPQRKGAPPAGTPQLLDKYRQPAFNGDRETAIGSMLEDLVYNPAIREQLEINAA